MKQRRIHNRPRKQKEEKERKEAKMTIIEKITALASAADADLKEDIEDVILRAGRYVAAVTEMECAAMNLQGRKGDEYRDEVTRTDSARTRAHDAFINAVNFANRIAASVGQEPIYTGGNERREYGDFAFEIVKEIYQNRQ